MTIDEYRKKLVETGLPLLGIKYEFGAEWTDYTKKPNGLDCSETIEGIYRISGLEMPDGAQAQFNFCLATDKPKPGDLAFFGKGKDIAQVYHVGMLYDAGMILEARAFDGRDWTGKVAFRGRDAWEAYKNFLGYRCHPKLAERVA